jgi:hypothetical protein
MYLLAWFAFVTGAALGCSDSPNNPVVSSASTAAAWAAAEGALVLAAAAPRPRS